MNIPLYARMNEFAPVSSGKGAVEHSSAASQEFAHDGQDEENQEESDKHGSLFEQCSPEIGKFAGKSSEGDAVAATGESRQDIAQRAVLTADVPELKIGSALVEGSLTDGYKLHDVALFDSGSLDVTTRPTSATEVVSKDFAQGLPVQSNVVPNLELDFSADVAA